MNYNNNYNPYGNPYYSQQPNYSYNQQPQQTNYIPLTFINGIEGAKAFIVGANQVVYLKDSDSNVLYEKKADAQGRYTLTAYELKEIDLNKTPKETQTNIEYVSNSDFVAFKNDFVEKMNILSSQIEKLVKTQNLGE